MAQKPIKISVDTITNDTVTNYSNIRKGDTLLMSISMFQNSADLNLTGQTVHVILKKADGYSVEKILTGLTSNIIPIAFDEQATIAIGEVVGEIQIIDANGCSISNHFIFDVGATNADDIIIASKNELDTLAKIQAVIDDYNNNKVSLDEANALAIVNIETLGTKITDGTELAERLETDIVTGTEVAVRLENDITIGQALDILLKATTLTGNTTNNNLLTSIANGNEVIANLASVNWAEVQSYISSLNTVFIGMPLTDELDVALTDEFDVALTM